MDSISNIADHTTRETESLSTATLQECFHDAIKDLQANLGQREQLLRQDAEHRENIAGLHEKLKGSNARICNLESQLPSMRAREAELKEQNQSLQTKLADLQTHLSSEDHGRVQLSEIRSELSAKAKALEKTKSDLSDKVEELRTLSATNGDLQSQVHGLEIRLANATSKVIDFTPEREELQRKHREELQWVQGELRQAAEEYKIQEKTKLENHMQRLTAQNDTNQRKIKALTQDLAARSSKVEELQKRAPSPDKLRESADVEKVARARQQEIQTLKNAVQKLENDARLRISTSKEAETALSAHISAEKAKVESLEQERAAALTQVEELKHSLEVSRSTEGETRVALEAQGDESEAEQQAMRKKLNEAIETSRRSEAGLQHYIQTGKETIEATKEQFQKQIDALQARLDESQEEARTKDLDHEEFRAKVSESWEHDQTKQQEQSAEARRKADKIAARKAELESENAALREALAKAEDKIAAAEQVKEHSTQQRPSSKGSIVSTRVFRVPLVGQGVTPTTSKKENEPPKPSKKVDRNANSVVDASAVPAPEILRRSNSRGNEGAPLIRGPVVEDSQVQVFDSQANEGGRTGVGNLKSLGSFLESEDMLDTASQVPRQLVEETQFDDYLPSFEAFNNGLSSSRVLKTRGGSSLSSLPSLRGASQAGSQNQPPLSQDQDRSQTVDRSNTTPNDFVIYEDSQDDYAHNALQDSITLSQAEKDMYTFKKSWEHPNSGKRRQSDSGSIPRSLDEEGRGQKRTPSVHPPSRGTNLGRPNQAVAAHSSSPDFVPSAHGHKVSTYQTPGGSAKHRTSRTDSGAAADPRLANREMGAPAGPKRKAEDHIVEGYEHERKKRLNSGDGSQEMTQRYSLRGATQPSINDLPQMPRTSDRGSSSSRMTTLGGRATRNARGVKKLSQSMLNYPTLKIRSGR